MIVHLLILAALLHASDCYGIGANSPEKFIGPSGPTTCTLTAQDFTTYTEQDAYSQITVTSGAIVYEGAGNNTAYVRKDFTAGHFNGDFTMKFEWTKSTTNSEEYGRDYSPILINSTAEVYGNTSNFVAVENYRSTTNTVFRIVTNNGGTVSYSSGVAITEGTNYFLTFSYDSAEGTYGRYTLDVYSGSHTGTLIGSVTRDAIESASYRYLYAYDTNKTGSAYDSEGIIANYEIGLCLE